MARQMIAVPFGTFIDRKSDASLRSDSRHLLRISPRRVCILFVSVCISARATVGQLLDEKFLRFEMEVSAFWALVRNQIAAVSSIFVVCTRLCFFNCVEFGERIPAFRKASRTFSW